jgi:hypothetical protein
MKQFFDRCVGFAVLALVVGGVLFWFLRARAINLRAAAAETAAHVQREKTVHDFGVKYNSIQDWEKSFTNKASVFTIDVQDAFLNKSAPLEFTGRLEDIHREAGHVVADFSSYAAPISLSLRLICTEDQRKILTDKAARFAIIANIQTVMKPGGFTVNGDYGEEGIEDPIFDADWASDTYWVTGTCLDLKKLQKLLDE